MSVPKENILAEDLHIRVHPGLRQLVEEKADLEGLALNEWVAKTLAQMLGKPEYGVVPRKRMGRPRKPRTFQAM